MSATQPALQNLPASAPFTAALRPGVFFPDWTAITTPAARETLTAILLAFDFAHRWDGYGEEEDRVRRAVIEGLADGYEPDGAWLAGRLGLDSDRVAVLLERLASRDLVVTDSTTNTIAGAYPLTRRSTEHRVRIGSRILQAMCAVDALGTGAMFHADAIIESRCRACGSPIRVATRNRGTALDHVKPDRAVVWSGIRYQGACAATSLCTVIAFFCSVDHRKEWCQTNHPDRGYRLSIEDAIELGRALFEPVLKPAVGQEERRVA